MKRKVLITIGYKKRELSYLTFLSYWLKKSGFEVKISYFNYELYHQIFDWQPDLVVIGQVNQNESIEFAQYANQSGCLVVVLNCEGLYDENQEISRFGHQINHFVDLLIAWGEQHKQDALKSSDIAEDKILVASTPKLDVYKKPLLNYFLTQKPYQNILDQQKPTICLATSFGSSETSWKDVEYNVAYQKIGQKNFDHRAALQRKLRDSFVQLAKKLNRTGKYNLIFRPHPLENVQFYREKLANLPQVIVDNGIPPITLFGVIDCLIHRSSTVATEAWLMKIPTVTFDSINNADKDILSFTKFEPVLKSVEEVYHFIAEQKYLRVDLHRKQKHQFLLNWYGFYNPNQQFSADKISQKFKSLSLKKKRRRLHKYVLIYLLISGLKTLLRKKYLYEVIGLFKDQKYRQSMSNYYIFDQEIKDFEHKYFQIFNKHNQ